MSLLRVRRLLEELRRGPSPSDVERALASVVVRFEDRTAVLSRDERAGGGALFDREREADRVRIGPRVLSETPTAEGRVRLLSAAAAIGPRVEVHAPIASGGTYLGRLVVDVPRRAARALGAPAAEPGDRFAPRFAHAFFDDEALVIEAARAGLRFVRRSGAWITLERDASVTAPSGERAFARELASAARTVRVAERLRLGEPPERAVSVARGRGRQSGRTRGTVGRARLRRAIGWIDAAHPGGPNCFRRTLVELALDAGAAGETLVFGLDVGETGHVAFKDAEDRAFDVVFEVPPS